jgi:hypothetical protein
MEVEMVNDRVPARITRQVDLLFEADRKKYYGHCSQIPILGGTYLAGEDVTALKKRACAALLAREWFAIHGPADAPPLPLSLAERERLKLGPPYDKIIALYARSLEGRKYNVKEHPSFFDYACGFMASDLVCGYYSYMQRDEQLTKRFPPRTLDGLGPGVMWQPPREH